MIRRIILMSMLWTGSLAAQTSATPEEPRPVAPASAPAVAAESKPAPKPSANAEFPFDRFPEFSAIMVGSVLSSDEREGHIYRSGHMLRTQSTVGLGYFLTDLKAHETYGLTTLGCLSDSHPYFRAFPFSAARPGRKVERVAGGKETVDGHISQIETITISGTDLALPIRMKLWEAEDLQGFPVKVQLLNGGGRGIIQYKDVVIGPVDPTLFIRPKRCVAGLPQPPDEKPAHGKKQAAPSADKPQP
jgi:hypothetical protein